MANDTFMPLAELPEAELFAELAQRHGHFCPMSTLGVRIGWAARQQLAGQLRHAVYRIKTCAGDGIKLALDCDELSIEECGKHLLEVQDEEGWLHLLLRPEALALAASYRLLASSAAQNALLDQLRTIDADSLLQITRSRAS